MRDFIICDEVLIKYIGRDKKVVIPDNVTMIGDEAFSECRWITEIIIPKHVTTIGNRAFFECGNLTSITLPDSITSIGINAFCWCSSLTSITIPDGITAINEFLFCQCSSLSSITLPNSITSIEEHAFCWCSSLTSITLPDSLTSIGVKAFAHCSNLTSIILPDSVTSIGVNAFCWCSSLTSITLPDSLTSIGAKAFYDCSSLTSIAIPDGVTSIGEGAFSGCQSLASITLPSGITSIQDKTFYDCSSLTSIDIPDSVTSIGAEAFSGCRSLTNLIIPDSVVSIGEYAFFGCESLTGITLPDRITSIEKCAFRYCEGLTSMVIPNGVTSIEEDAFSKCYSLTSIVLPSSVHSVCENAFAGCKNLNSFSVLNPKCKFESNLFGDCIPVGLLPELKHLCPCLTDQDLKKYVLQKAVWSQLPQDLQMDIFVTCQKKSLLEAYADCITEPEILANNIRTQLSSGKVSSKMCYAAAICMILFSTKISESLLRQLYEQLPPLSIAEKARKAIESDVMLAEKLNLNGTASHALCPLEKAVLACMEKEQKSIFALETQLKQSYRLSCSDLPELDCIDGSQAGGFVLAYLLTIHETVYQIEQTQQEVIPTYVKPGVSASVTELLSLLNQDKFQATLLTLADMYLGQSRHNKKRYLAYPICRYASESTMEILTKRAPEWRSKTMGNDAPLLAAFRKAVVYSETKAALQFANRFGDLQNYAKLRHTDVDTIRKQLANL